ncbi:MAG TPA: UDP-N-acetylglucosamine pyrophosphorylase [Planctomycetaceae bacterium]|nr:UDP-N-acetylglucosamine pyrophosphorylase [Planctomycetaceae bacterium]HCK53302.1 UDP-N-acetylglucosamine pyrophosphorylase [Planctomycetaceae bacterium]
MNDLLVRQLADAGQLHLLEEIDFLEPSVRKRFESELELIDWEELGVAVAGGDRAGDPAEAVPELPHLVRQPEASSPRARDRGEALLADGRVAVVTVAGGRGSRLGSDSPKGLFPVMPVSRRTLFEHFAAAIGERSRRAGRAIPWLVMTSHVTDAPTRLFFRQQDFFGLDPGQVVLFQQGAMPVVDVETGRVLLAGAGQVALNPDGHGGLVAALRRSGMFEWLSERAVDTLFYHQVDNPAVLPPDPLLVGWHHERGSQMTTRVVPRIAAEERMGVAVSVEGRTRIVEYLELLDSAAATDATGRLRFWAGNTGVHVLDKDLLERAADAAGLPWHRVRRSVACTTGHRSAVVVQPECRNAWQLEKYIFDLLADAETGLVVEGDRAVDFLPIKQATGADSLESARSGLLSLYRGWLEAAGATVHPDAVVEIAPGWALSAADAAGRVDSGDVFGDSIVLE